MSQTRAAVFLLLLSLSLPAQSPIRGPRHHPVFVKGLVKHAPAGMKNPNNLGHSSAIADLPDASSSQQALTDKAFGYANMVASSPEFEVAVLHMDIPGCYQKNYYDSQFAFTDEAVYNLMLDNSPVTLNVIWYDGEHPSGPGSNQGYEVVIFDKTIGTNQNAVAQEDGPDRQAAFVASLILHESSHVLGFRHPFCLCHKPIRSVPYNMNRIYNLVAGKTGLPLP